MYYKEHGPNEVIRKDYLTPQNVTYIHRKAPEWSNSNSMRRHLLETLTGGLAHVNSTYYWANRLAGNLSGGIRGLGG